MCGVACKRWCFTLNNYTEEEYKASTDDFASNHSPIFLIVAREVGESGTPHLQGFVHLSKKLRITQLKKIVSVRAHFEKAKGSDKDNEKYCSKEYQGNLYVFGRPVENCSEAGGRTVTYHQAFDCAQALVKVGGEPYNLLAVHGQYSGVYCQYQKAVESLARSYNKFTHIAKLKSEFQQVRLKVYQHNIVQIVDGEPDPRKIYWYWESQGNVGKTWLSKYLVVTREAVRFENAKSADIKYSYKGEKIVIFDYTRSQMDHLNYEVLESIKNGIYFNSKYESDMRVFATPHVVCFANSPPDQSRMSGDRWVVRELQGLDLCYSVPLSTDANNPQEPPSDQPINQGLRDPSTEDDWTVGFDINMY